MAERLSAAQRSILVHLANGRLLKFVASRHQWFALEGLGNVRRNTVDALRNRKLIKIQRRLCGFYGTSIYFTISAAGRRALQGDGT